MRLVCDTDFLSALYKIERIGLIYEVFGVDTIYVTQAVMDELAKAPFFYDFIRKTEKIERVVVDEVPSHIQSAMLGPGEMHSISYALKTGSIFLSNDKKAGEFAEELGVVVLDIISFLIVCREIGIIGLNDIEHIIELLKQRDYMEFDEETKKMLLRK
ncbi:MAG: hypothetical protein P1P69_08210 [Methanosarcinaceae archaeon]|nr:hypothetical protein [Methanosarcinaceae archaeon]